ncbi:MAG: ATP-binding protein, partial [Myxococcales bacterium]
GPRIVYVNDALCRLTGYRPEEILGRTPSLLAGPDCKRETILRMRQEMVAGRPFFGEMTNYRKDGSSFPAELQITPVTGSDGRVTHYLSSRRDLTERKQLHAKLSLAERMASIGALAAGVAHEINNPLAFIVSNLDYLRRELQRLPVARERPELHTALSECAAGAERVRAIVRDLKVFSRDAGDERSVVQLNAVVQSALKMAAHEIGTRARVVQELGAPPAVEVNEVRLGQVLLNLLVNAAQAIPPGESRQHEIRVRTGGELHTGAWVEISDTGEGIAPEVLPRIFEPFFTTKDVGVGTGLGLTLCHQLVTAMHGEITVSSTPGRGSTFRVRLPATARTAERVEETPRSPEGGERVEETPRSPEGGERARVLIIDDEPRIGDSTRRVLEPDFEVDVTSRADDALARIEEGRVYEVILCDLHMPGMTGMDFFEVLRERRPALADRVLFFSGGAFTQASQAFVAKHRDVVLEKPVRPERLATAIG